jgi:Protein of unknown function (DUF3887)
MAEVAGPAMCEACGRQLPPQQGRGRRRRYCDATCRSAGRRQRVSARHPGPVTVKEMLTSPERHDNLDIVGGSPDVADQVAVRVRDTARRLVEELAHPGAGSPLDAVVAARELSAAADVALRAAVDRARAAGHSWSSIGDVLETTRQAAFQRFGRPVDPRTGKPMSWSLLPDAADRAVALVGQLVEGRWEEMRQDFDETMREGIGADRIASVWAHAMAMVGRCEHIGEPSAHLLGAYTVVDVPLHCEAGELTGQVTYDRDGKIAGLLIRPVSA